MECLAAVGGSARCAPIPDVGPTESPERFYEGGVASPDSVRIRALTRIQQLFAKVYGWLSWNLAEGEYKETAIPVVGVTVPNDISAQGAPPTVKSVGVCNPDGTCVEGPEGSITINGASSGRVAGSGGSLPVTVRFYAYAQDNQLPLKYAAVDWDADGTTRNLVGRDTPGLYRNHRGTTVGGVTQCDGGTFGRIKGETCDDTSPFTYNYVYTCPSDARLLAASGELRRCGTPAPGIPAAAAELDSNCWSESDQACQFRPRVQVKDNWGFCNGVCPGAPAGGNCYDGGVLNDMECALPQPDDNPWTSFSGRVLVRP